MNTKEVIRNFLTEELLSGHRSSPADDEELLLSGAVDSIAVMRFVAFIEETFHLTVPPDDVTIENFSTLGRIEKYVREHQSRRSTDPEAAAGET